VVFFATFFVIVSCSRRSVILISSIYIQLFMTSATATFKFNSFSIEFFPLKALAINLNFLLNINYWIYRWDLPKLSFSSISSRWLASHLWISIIFAVHIQYFFLLCEWTIEAKEWTERNKCPFPCKFEHFM